MEISSSKKRLPVVGKWLISFVAVGLLVGWLSFTPAGLLGKADAIGYAVCHRIDDRSFHIGVRQMPLCARCSGMYLGALLGIAYQLRRGKRGRMPSWPKLAFFAALVAAFAVDGANSYLHFFPMAPSLYETQNWLRLLTGTGMGLALSVILVPSFHQTLWQDWVDQPALDSWRSVGILVFLAAVIDVLLLTEAPWLLYGLALLSSLSVLTILAIVYSMLCILLTRMDNRYTRLRQAWVPLLAGAIVALTQILVIDLGRYWLTGTWQGFDFLIR